MSTQTTARQPKGVPVGGQFATTALAESGTTLMPERDWGAVNLQVGSQTPWGKADSVHDLGPGAVQVSTPGHGGVKLSATRNRAVHASIRSRDGWYEEDCEFHAVAFTHPDLELETPEQAARGMKSWFPDQYEAITGETIAPGESHQKDQRAWHAKHADDQVVISAITSETHPGMVELTTTLGGARTSAAFEAERTFLVPTERYRQDRDSQHGFVVDPALYEDITKPKAPKTVLPRFRGVHFEGMSAAGEARTRKALAGRWRSAGDPETVRTLAHIIAEDGISGKSSHVNNGRRTYFLKTRVHAEDSASTAYAVPKALFDAMDAPDERTPRDLARDEWKLADHQVDQARRARDWAAVQSAQLKAAQARKTYDTTLEN